MQFKCWTQPDYRLIRDMHENVCIQVGKKYAGSHLTSQADLALLALGQRHRPLAGCACAPASRDMHKMGYNRLQADMKSV